ncbi:piriformospora indica-insensitive protein 2 [Mercurialis annua]|uniref:piriformospora indica-insensitive protein 2 n=1 Tax=Mercurialis annua TaxID=3986 RepID=UPI002160409B|nr:piriformospora indica-insensitive protein 2 [Mercurialis annua]
MATLIFFLIITLFSSSLTITHQQQDPLLDSAEQDSVYQVLSSINPSISWRTLFPPDDFCFSPPHGVVCDYFIEENAAVSLHISELSFGYVSDYSPNPPCSSNSVLDPLLFTSFKYLRKLFFYKCFTEKAVLVPDVSKTAFGSSNLEELVFIENPALVGSVSGIIGNYTDLRRLVLSGNGVYGSIPDQIGDLVKNVEEITLSRNKLTGGFPFSLTKLKKLRVLDLGQNQFDGNVPDSVGNLSQLLKLDLSSNGFFGKIPEGMVNFQTLEFLDLSFNRFGNFGIPLFLGELSKLKEVYLSGNLLGGYIPEIWKNLGGVNAIGFSNMGLIGKIPGSMGVYLRNLSYLGLDNNKLEGEVPKELGFLEFVNEINLENNSLSGEIPFTANFTARVGEKLKLNGNSKLCVIEGSLGKLKLCNRSDLLADQVLFKEGSDYISSLSPSRQVSSSSLYGLMMVFYFLLW